MGSVCNGGDSNKDEITLDVTEHHKKAKSSSSSKKKDRKSKKSKKEKKQKKSKKEAKGTEAPAEKPIQTNDTIPTETWDDNDFETLLPSKKSFEITTEDKDLKAYTKDSRKKALEVAQDLDNIEWDLKQNKNGVQIYLGKTSGEEIFLRRETEVNADIETTTEYLKDYELRVKLADRIEKVDLVESYDSTSELCYQKMKGNLIFKARDFSFFSKIIDLKNGDRAIIEYSVENDAIPETKAVRAELENLCWLKKISDTETAIIHLIHIFIKGKVPGFAKSMMPKKHLQEFTKLKEIIESGSE
ncbi:unnamed protein product [Moneuplotes crassus]|uniref:START domain-containing protein n=1 Tax=Euplotes crassus TaxID=5936 RepID=A0AAD1XLT0_EUPCR|nr:unnamed protein product [Moneuplotes crassus]